MAEQQEMNKAFEKSVIEFSVPLYRALDKGGNAFFSPYSVSAALMLLMLGTDGETKSELETALKLKGIIGCDAHTGYNALYKKLSSRSGQGILVAIANRIFAKQGEALCKDFSDNAMKYYESEVESMDFENKSEESRLKINSWIEKQTRDKIKDLIPQGLIKRDTMMVLTNAIYFKGDWEFKFDEVATSKQPFFINESDTVDVDMMANKKKVKSGECEELGCKCLQLPYKEDALSMVILLPNEKAGLSALEDKLTSTSIEAAIANTYKQETEIFIPKFKLESTYKLTETLPKIGIKKIFQSTADFSAMFQDGGKDLCVTDVIHKAFVEVNEEGTEAAAATAIMITRMMMPMDPFSFRADHPFVFLIRENESGTILFMGRYAAPI